MAHFGAHNYTLVVVGSVQKRPRHVFSRKAVFNARYVEKPETLLHFLVDCDRISKNLMFFFSFLESLVLPAVYKIEKFTNRMDGNPRELLNMRDIRCSSIASSDTP